MHRPRYLAHAGGGRAAARRGQHGARLDAHVGRPVGIPVSEPPGDRGERVLGPQVVTGGGHLSDRVGLRRVVGPLPRREPTEAAADHGRRLALRGQRRGAELVAGAECVAASGSEEYAARAVGLGTAQLHHHQTPTKLGWRRFVTRR